MLWSGRKYFANYISEKGQIPRLYEGKNSTAKKPNSLIRKWAKKKKKNEVIIHQRRSIGGK